MYLLYESLYGELLYECDSTNIIGLFSSKEKAIEKAKKMIKEQLENDNTYVLDNEKNDIENDNLVRFFFNNQDNWNCFYDIIIEKLELDKEV